MKEEKKTLDLLDISPYVRYVHAIWEAVQERHQVPWRCIYDYEFLLVTAGSLEIVTEENTLYLSADQIHIVPPMRFHTIRIPEGERCSYYSIHFDFIDLGRENDFSYEEYTSQCNRNLEQAIMNERLVKRPLYALGSLALPETVQVIDTIAYTEHLKTMILLQREKPFAWEIDMKCEMLSILKLLLNDIRRTKTESPRKKMEHFSDIAAYLFDHYGETIDFESLSRIFGYSYSSFRKQFKEKTGKSPHEYLVDLRMERAVALLNSQQYTVTEVALMVGYEDSSYFSRVFRKKKGCSPSSFLGGK
ncbi:MAG: helix-turn-helix transcriptional regulator [Clostridia bacterium]|nr:helix-turn-helix transcriptional regulator [Clostridia bacterium]